MAVITEIPQQQHQSKPVQSAITQIASLQPAVTQSQPRQQEVQIPVNPKGYFANERTFLHWQSLTLILGSVGIGLLNFSDLRGQISGIIFILAAMSFSFYALIQFHKRQDLLSKKEKGAGYEDVGGLIMMIFVVFGAVFVNFGLHFVHS